MSQGSVRGFVAAIAIAVVVGLGWFAKQFLDSDAPKLGIEPPAAAASTAADRIAPAATAAPEVKGPTPVRDIETVAVAPTLPPPASPLPASYRKALSGLRGRLVEEDGKPVAGLKVELLEVLGSGMQGDFEHAFAELPANLPTVPPLSIADGVSDAQGVFELHGALLVGFHGLGVDLGGPRGTLRFVDRTLASGEVTDLGDIALSPFVTWKGSVVDEDGKPIPGARVRATLFPPLVFQPGVADTGRVAAVMEVRNWGNAQVEIVDLPPSVRAWDSKLPFPTARTKDDGTFELAGVPQGLATLVVDRDGFAGTFKGPTATAKRDRDIGAITLSRGRTLTGTVVDAAGKPVYGAQVMGGVVIDAARMALCFPATAPTGADGAFTIEHLSDQGGDLRVAARSAASDRWVVEASDDDSKPITITLPVGRSIEVHLVRTGAVAVPDAELSLRPRNGPPFLTFAPPTKIAPARIETIGEGKLLVRGLLPGDYQLIGRAPGLAMAQTNLDIANTNDDAGTPIVATLEFTAARSLAVRVFDRDTKQPIEHAEVTATFNERMSPPIVARRSDASGLATLAGLPLRSVTVRAFHPAYAATSQIVALDVLPEDAPGLDLVLGPGATLHGHVHHGGKPLAEPMLFFLDERNEGKSIDDDIPRFAVPGLDGTFTLKGLRPGRARWEVMQRLFAGEPQQALQGIMDARRAGGASRRGNVELEEGKTVELDVDIDPAAADKPARISGIVRVKGGSGDFVVRVDCSSPRDQSQRTQKTADVRANQHFNIEPIAAGWVNLSIERKTEPPPDQQQNDWRGPALHQEWFEIEGGEEHVLEVEFDFAAAEVRVVDAAGQPLPGVNVSFEWQQPSTDGNVFTQSVWGNSGPDGIAHVELPRPGHFTIRTQHAEQGRASCEADLPSRTPVTLTLDRGVPCSGRIEIDPDPGDVHVWFSISELRDGNQNYDGDSWLQLEKGKRDFAFTGLGPGKYRANIFIDSGKNGQIDFELGHNGDDHLVLKFKTK